MGTVGARSEERPGELTSELRCCCPACEQDTGVALELVGFLSRCERCGALLQVELAAPVTPVAALVAIDQVRERTARDGRIASLLVGQPWAPGIGAAPALPPPLPAALPPAPDGLATLAADRAVPPARWRAALARRRRLGTVAVAGCLALLGLLPLLGAAVALRSVSQPPQASRAARQTPPAAEASPGGPTAAGELLPESP